MPKYFLIAIWGSTNKEYGAMKLTLYSFFGGALVFIGILAAYVTAGTLDLQQLAQFQFTPQLQAWAFPVLFLGFAVLAGIWPLHTWAPTGHVAAPTAGSMLLAGIVMKLGAYAALRVAMNLFPQGFQMWKEWIAVLGVIGIVYAAAVALRQRDLKFVIGYSSVSHMGFILLGLATANALGVSGAVLQMFSHGVIGALLFAIAGRMIYPRTHTRDLDQLSRMKLGRVMPFAAFAFVIASAASMGIPGFSGFAAEITILIGTWKAYPMAVWITGIGMVLVAAFTLRALRKTFFDEPYRHVRLQEGRIAFIDADEHPTSMAASPSRRNWAPVCSSLPLSPSAFIPNSCSIASRPRSKRCAFSSHELSGTSPARLPGSARRGHRSRRAGAWPNENALEHAHFVRRGDRPAAGGRRGAQAAAAGRSLSRDARDHAADLALQGHLPGARFFHRRPRARRSHRA